MTFQMRSFHSITLFTALVAATVSCSDGTSPKPAAGQPILATHLDSLFALGDTSILTVSNATTNVVWMSRDRFVAIVTQNGRVSAIAPGATYVLAMGSSGLADSARVVVQQRTASIAVTPSAIARPLLRTQLFLATALDARGAPVPGVPIVWSVSGSGATIDNTGLATGQAVGTTTIRATAGSVTDTATLTVTPMPSIHFTRDTFDVGIGQFLDGNAVRVVADSIATDESFRPTLSIDNVGIANVAGGVLVPEYPGIDYGQALQLAGVAPGIAHLTVSATRYAQGSAAIRVSKPRLLVTGRSTLAPNGGFDNIGYVAVAADSLGSKHNLIQPLTIRLRTTTPGVLSPADTTISMPAIPAYAGLPIRRGTPGQSWIVVSAPGYQSDSLFVSVTDAKLRFADYPFFGDLSDSYVGAGELQNGSLSLWVGTDIPTDLPITFTQRHPDVVRFPTSMLLPAYDRQGYVSPRPIGLKPGTDTIVATAPGYLPDTVIFHVTTGTYLITNVPAAPTIGFPFVVSVSLADSLGTMQFPASTEARALVSSSDPAVLRPASDTVTIGNGTGGYGVQINVVGAGTATLTFRDPAGQFASKISAPINIAPANLILTPFAPTFGGPPVRSVGMHQVIAASLQLSTQGYVLPDGVQLRSSDPTIAQPSPTRVAFGVTNQIAIIGGERAGSAWIVASAPGIVSDSVPVDVGKPAVVVITQSSATVGQVVGDVRVELRDQTGQPRATNEDVTFRIVSSNSGVVAADSTLLTVRRGFFQSNLSSVRFLGAGTAVLRAIDDRIGSFAYDAGASDLITVSTPPSSP